MKSMQALGLGLVLVLGLSGCAGSQVPQETEAARPVVTESVSTETRDDVLEYIGVVSTESARSISFRTGGKLAEVLVAKGDVVTTGMRLAVLDDTDLRLGVDAAAAQLDAAQAQYDKAVNGASSEDRRNAELNVQKAEDARDYAADLLEKTEVLYASGAAASAEVDKLKLELDVRESELSQAREVLSQVRSGARAEDVDALAAQVGQAQANLAVQQRMLDDAVLVADADGTVLNVPVSAGELVSAGYPVAVVGSDVRTVKTGVTATDLSLIRVGQDARIGDAALPARVLRVSDVPDQVTLTYEVELALEAQETAKTEGLVAGRVENVQFLTGKVTGLWVPISTVIAEGGDHVFLAVDGKAVRTPVTLLEATGMEVRVEGIPDGSLLIVEGAQRLTDGEAIVIAGQEATP